MNRRVLIIEDDKHLAESLKNIFVKRNISVKVSHSAKQAEHLISLEKYSLLVVDVVLPKINGIDFLKKIIPRGLLHSSCKVWLVSGVVNQQVISKDLMGHVDLFLKKPFHLHTLGKNIDRLFTAPEKRIRNMRFFYLSWKSGDCVLENKKYIIKGHELMFICFYLHFIRFSGVLDIQKPGGDEEIQQILFREGCISSFKCGNKNSYLGRILMKNSLVREEDIKKLLAQKSDLPLGERLVAECYISPHQLQKMLQEQLAIRLFETMTQASISVSSQSFTASKEINHAAYLGMSDLLRLVDNWIQSKVSKVWLKDFFENNQKMRIRTLKRLKGKKWGYSALKCLASPPLPEGNTLSFALQQRKGEEEQARRELYCRLLVGENCLEYPHNSQNQEKSYEFMEKQYKAFLKAADTNNYFSLLDLPLSADRKQVEEAYRNMVKIFHPDRRDQDMPEELVKLCDQCFILVGKIYQTLSDPEEKKKYLEMLSQENKVNVMSIKNAYIKGKKSLESGHYESAEKQLESIYVNKQARGDTVLLYIWAIIKRRDFKIPREEEKKIEGLFENVGLDQKQSPMFFFVKALFMRSKGDRRSAFDLFTKALLLDSKLTVARVERHALGVVRKKAKKSFMDLFRKGA